MTGQRRYRFRQDPATRCTVTGKTYYVAADGYTFRIEATAVRSGTGGKRFYEGSALGHADTYVLGFGRAAIEDAIAAKVAELEGS